MASPEMIVPERRQFSLAGAAEASERLLNSQDRAAIGAPLCVTSAPWLLHFSILTKVMPLTRLLASKKLPSRVTEVLRTIFPPPGIAQLWNFSALGSKRTMVFGFDPDSLYQIMSLIAEMPYGSDFGPLGDCHSLALPVSGSRRPR